MSEENFVHAPFSEEQVALLDIWQRSANVHPFTCGKRGDPGHTVHPEYHDLGALVPTTTGWICPDCDYTQDWAHATMVDPDKARYLTTSIFDQMRALKREHDKLDEP